MRAVSRILSLVSVGLAVACASGTGPEQGGDVPGALVEVQAAGKKGGNRVGGSGDSSATVLPTLLRFAPWAPPLESYDTTFMVTQGKASSDTLYFAKSTMGPRMPYLIITVPRDAQFVDAAGRVVPKGTVVPLTVQADREYVRVNFGPHGSTFSKNPAMVQVSWFFTDLLSRAPSGLKLWYQSDNTAPWQQQPAVLDLQFYWLTTTLDHFSNYAVAY